MLTEKTTRTNHGLFLFHMSKPLEVCKMQSEFIPIPLLLAYSISSSSTNVKLFLFIFFYHTVQENNKRSWSRHNLQDLTNKDPKFDLQDILSSVMLRL